MNIFENLAIFAEKPVAALQLTPSEKKFSLDITFSTIFLGIRLVFLCYAAMDLCVAGEERGKAIARGSTDNWWTRLSTRRWRRMGSKMVLCKKVSFVLISCWSCSDLRCGRHWNNNHCTSIQNFVVDVRDNSCKRVVEPAHPEKGFYMMGLQQLNYSL